jgi:hydroxymethylpyrimidine/phosphomethylpyrimidine kinase
MPAKQNITLAVEKRLLKKARAYASGRGTSVSAMLADELTRILAREEAYEQAKTRALARLSNAFHLGGGGIQDRNALHDRTNLR